MTFDLINYLHKDNYLLKILKQKFLYEYNFFKFVCKIHKEIFLKFVEIILVTHESLWYIANLYKLYENNSSRFYHKIKMDAKNKSQS